MASWAASDLFGAITRVGRCTCSTTCAIVNVLPVPVAPSSVTCSSPRSHRCRELLDGRRLIAGRAELGADGERGHPGQSRLPRHAPGDSRPTLGQVPSAFALRRLGACGSVRAAAPRTPSTRDSASPAARRSTPSARNAASSRRCSPTSSTCSDGSSRAPIPRTSPPALRPFHELMRRQIEGFGGTVEKIIGNVMFGVFGAPITHEDDAERASVRAAHQRGGAASPARRPLVAGGAGRRRDRRGRRLARPGPRIGERVTGDVVNTASRLQSTAPPDGIVVAESTYLATQFDFRWQELRPVTVKGKADPIRDLVADRVARAHGDRAARPDGRAVRRAPRRAAHTLRTEFLSSMRDRRPATGDDRRRRRPRQEPADRRAVGRDRRAARSGAMACRPAAPLRRHDGLRAVRRHREGRVGHPRLRRAREPSASKLDVTLQRVSTSADEPARLHRHLLPLVTARGRRPTTPPARRRSRRGRRSSNASPRRTRRSWRSRTCTTPRPALFSFLDLLLDRVGAVPLIVVVAGRRELFEVRPGWGDRPGATHDAARAAVGERDRTARRGAARPRHLVPPRWPRRWSSDRAATPCTPRSSCACSATRPGGGGGASGSPAGARRAAADDPGAALRPARRARRASCARPPRMRPSSA